MRINKNIVKSVSFVVLTVAIIGLLTPVLAPTKVFNGVMDEPDGSLQYVAFGDSECNAGFSPMEIWKDYGFAGYNCGVSAQRIQDTYYLVDKVLEHQQPQAIFLETNLIYRHMLTVDEVQASYQHLVERMLPALRFHARWKQLLDPLAKSDGRDALTAMLKGMRFKTDEKGYSGGPYATPTDQRQRIGILQRMYLDRIVKLCRSKGITLILYASPSPACWNMQRHNGLADYAKDNGLSFIDMNLDPSAYGIDWSQDTYDGGDHLNFFGATKVSRYLGSYLRDKSGLTDRRGQPSYEQWERTLDDYLKKTKDVKAK